MEDGMTLDELFEYTNIDPWFLNQLAELHQAEQWLKAQALNNISRDDFIQANKRGFSDLQISRLTGMRLDPSPAQALQQRKEASGVLSSVYQIQLIIYFGKEAPLA